MCGSSVKSRAGFDLYKLRPVEAARTCFVPALFGCAADDVLVRPHHSQLIFDEYAGDKNVVRFEGDHNDIRPGFFLDSACIFLKQARAQRPTAHRFSEPNPLTQLVRTRADSCGLSSGAPHPRSRMP